MNYVSTRGLTPAVTFTETLINGLAPDGGLYLPITYPLYDYAQLREMQKKTYSELAEMLLWPFLKDSKLSQTELAAIIKQSYKNFAHPAICPLIQTQRQEFIAELFHGPTMAFKDIALQLLAPLTTAILGKTKKQINIVAATSGDTGSAAIHAFAAQPNTNIFILFPKDRISQIQQKQMTTTGASNVFAIAIDGSFDDCQAIVKSLFNDMHFRSTVAPTAVNSINWARILIQSVYYFYTALALGCPDRPLNFCVPTGNFGNIFSGFVAKEMGLPIKKLIMATNENDILTRVLQSGVYSPQPIYTTTSPSMDIQIASNFERLLFEASAKDAKLVNTQMHELYKNGLFKLELLQYNEISKLFCAGTATIQQVNNTIADLYQHNNYLCDPHTAVALHVSRNQQPTSDVPTIVFSTASSAKFPETVKTACGIFPKLPAQISHIMHKQEIYYKLANNAKVVQQFIYDHI